MLSTSFGSKGKIRIQNSMATRSRHLSWFQGWLAHPRFPFLYGWRKISISSWILTSSKLQRVLVMPPSWSETFCFWYSVVDACQQHAAILQLMGDISRKQSSFVWKVIFIHPSRKTQEYRELERVQNARSKQQHTYQCTVYNLLCGLRI